MFGFLEMNPPSRIAKLHRCRCGRWLMNLAPHVSCAPIPIPPAKPDVNNDLRRKRTTAPWRTPVSFEQLPSKSRTAIRLDCGHVTKRFNCDIKAKPARVRCRECAPVPDEGSEAA